MTEPLPTLVAFGEALRSAGLPVGTGEIITYAAAAAALGPASPADLYWAGRATLVTRREEIAAYDSLFAQVFLGRQLAAGESVEELLAPDPAQRSNANVAEIDPTAPAEVVGAESVSESGTQASEASGEALLHRSLASATPDEALAMARIARTFRLRPPLRRTRRLQPSRRGPMHDLRRTVRETLRTHGEPRALHHRERRWRPRRIVLVLDVSGSMRAQARTLLQFAHSASRSTRDTEVFVFGTRLTRITAELRHRSIDAALARAADAVVDFAGGTQIGRSLSTFVNTYGRRGIARGAIVVVCSDGLDRGRPADLVRAVRRLRRQCHALVWLSPLAYPSEGMTAVEPYVDAMLPARDLADLADFASRLSTLERRRDRVRAPEPDFVRPGPRATPWATRNPT